MKKKWILFAYGILSCATWLSADAGNAARSSFILTQKTDGYLIDYTPLTFPFTTIEIGRQPHLLFENGATVSGNGEGQPLLPVEVLSLGIPFGTRVTVNLIDPVYDVVENQLVAPSPHYEMRADSSMAAIYTKDALAYGSSGFYPADHIIVEPSFTLRQQRIGTVRIFPYQYNPATRTIRKLLSAKIDFHFIQPGGTPVESPDTKGDPYFEQVYKSLIVNYEQAKQWRQPIGTSAMTPPDSTRDWFVTGQDYYRIPIAKDGWYRITKGDITAAGGNPSQMDVNTVKMYVRGAEIPCLIRPDSSIEFYAMHKYGDSTYYDYWTDTNAYWLTWGGTAGLRYATISEPSGTPGSSRQSSVTGRHFEQNPSRYSGTAQLDVLEDEDIPGETWYWKLYFPNNEFTYNLALDTIDAAAGPTSKLRVWFYGTTTSSSPPPVSHRARIWLNDSLIGDKAFSQRKGALLDTTFPASWMMNGTNVLRVRSMDTGVIPNQFYLDWIELNYSRFLVATNDQLEFVAPIASGGSPVLFTVAGFSIPQIDVFDVTGKRQITGGVVTGNGTIGYSIAFKDTLSIPKKYLVVAASGRLPVFPMVKKQFSDIRVNAQGADYLTITHRNFRTAAQQLATHRQTTNGVRTAIIDIQDIYDEFNYGVMNEYAMKGFLRYAYQNWPTPAPTYLLIFGDACRDPHKWESVTTNYNFVPGHGGFPTGDNWFACFNASLPFIPSMIIGRIPVDDSLHALRMVSKIIQYENYSPAAWNKSYLAITGPTSASEIISFASSSDNMINTFLVPPPLGANIYRAFKSSVNPLFPVDGSRMQEIHGIVNNGVVFINYLGHASGQVWALDVGNPNNLQNTNGRWPFVAAVSCNTGAFATAGGRSLGEDFALADNRGAIAEWGASGFGYENVGQQLVNHFLFALSADSMRETGALTTTARYRLWQTLGSGLITIAHVKLTPLLGDPLTKLAIPLKPDLALSPGSISVNKNLLSSNDSTLTVKLTVENYGLVPADSIAARLTDTYNGQTYTLIQDKNLPPTSYRDSLFIPWDASGQVGMHTLAAVVDPNNAILEVNELNNTASSQQYVYANLLAAVKPFNNMVVPPGVQTLVVTSPVGLDSMGLQYFFELDTVVTFDSPFLVSSGPVNTGVVSGEWSTPSLPNGGPYFWRARTMVGGTLGNWVTSAFLTSSDLPSLPNVRWRENTRKQFALEQLTRAAATDSGVTILPNPTINISTRSLGSRNGSQNEYYSAIDANENRLLGYPWIWGRGFIGLRVDHVTGKHIFKGFDLPTNVSLAETLRAFIATTLVGNYLAFAVVNDGRTNVTENVYLGLESLGSTLIRQVQPGQSWTLIGRKGSSGPGMTPIESLTNDSAKATFTVSGYFSSTSGSLTTTGMALPMSWDSFHWRPGGLAGVTEAHVALLAVRPNGIIEKLRVIPMDTTDFSLAFLTPLTSGQAYSSFRSVVYLSTTNTQYSPGLKDWWVDFAAPADLAISARTVGVSDVTIEKGSVLNLPVTVHNIGFQGADSAHITVSMYDKFNKARPIAYAHLDTIPVSGSKSTTIPISTTNFSRRVTLQISVAPSQQKRDLVTDNNVAYYSFTVIGNQSAAVRLYADGIQLMDGDYVSPRPTIGVQVNQDEEKNIRQAEFYVDNVPLGRQHKAAFAKSESWQMSVTDDLRFNPTLTDGPHELMVRMLVQADNLGNVDTVQQAVSVNVLSENRIMQLYNYPNPFARETEFTFTLTGANAPDGLVIRIFTVAGRKIRELSISRGQLQIGFNRVYWDGRDNDGDEVANGYYLYQVSIKADGKTISAIEKLAKVR